MDRRIIRARTIVVIVTTGVLGIIAASGVGAQTLTDPHPKTNASPPTTATTKSRPAAHVKNCSAYGAGFMVMPGTDMCIKIGGSVTVEASH
jgi:Porin subfamily